LELGHEPNFELVDHLVSGSGRTRQARGGVELAAEAQGKVGPVPRVARPASSEPGEVSIRFAGRAGGVGLPDARAQWSVSIRRSGIGTVQVEGVEFLDADAVGERVTLRRWRSGDRYRPLGSPGRAKVGDVFTNRRVPVAERRVRWVMETNQGALCWVEGLPPGHDFRIRNETRRVIRWKWKRPSLQA